MRGLLFRQAIVKKGFFIIFIVLLCLQAMITNASAAGMSGANLMGGLKNGSMSLGQASSTLSSQGNLPTGSSSQLLQGLQNGGNISTSQAGGLLDNIMGGNSGINAGNIGNVTSMVQNLQSGQASPSSISSLLSQVSGGQLPSQVGQALSGLQNLGDVKSIGDLFQNSNIASSLQSVLQQTGAPKEVTNAISQITQIATNATDLQQTLQQAGAQAVSQAIAQALQQVAPQLVQALGGIKGLTDAISSLLGGSPTTDSQNDPTDDGLGEVSGDVACSGCNCSECVAKIQDNHNMIRAHVTSEFEQHRNWIVTTYFLDYILPAMMLMTNELTTNMMQQVEIIGTFFDAKHQLETKRLFQQMTAQAHKDYHPSEGLCEIGTNIRSLAISERKADLAHHTLASRMMQRQLSSGEAISTEGGLSDRKSRLKTFLTTYCNPEDNGDGLKLLCGSGAKDKARQNIDVNYTTAIENKLTLELDFSKDGASKTTDDEENIFALGANLFSHKIGNILTRRKLADGNGVPRDEANTYINLRAIAAKRSVAQNSFAAITGMKAEGDGKNGAAPFLKAILAELGISTNEIDEFIGEKPSYFAQMEVMTKILYQNPTFYTNLYDKPVNIERKGAALQAISLMQDRDIYKSLLRSEAVLSVLLETLLLKEHDRVSGDLAPDRDPGEKYIQ